MGVSAAAWRAVVRRPRVGWRRMPKILVSKEALLWEEGPGMGERAKGVEEAAISGMVRWSMKVKAVRLVPPVMAALRGVS
jgi:hypothetical protein